MRATPESSNSPRSRASAAVSGRIAVPALPRKSLAGARGARPPRPVMCTLLPASSTAQPIRRNAASITRGAGVGEVWDVEAAARFIDGAADLAQCVEHHAGVVGRQQLMHGGGAVAER